MSVLEWKNINLLNLHPVEMKLQHIKAEITCICYNNTKKVIADSVGNVYVYSSKWDVIAMFQAHCNPIKLCEITPGDANHLLVTLEQNSSTYQIFLQVFDVNTIRKREGANCVGNAKLSASSIATALRIQPIGNQICIVLGFERGNLMVYRAQVNRDMSSQFRTVNVCLRGITCLEFNEIDSTTWNLFVCSHGGIFCYTVTDGNIISDTKNVLDAKNVATSCSSVGRIDGESYFTVGRDDAIYCFTSDGRGPCYGIDGQKQLIAWFGNHLVVVKKCHSSFIPQDVTQLSSLLVIDVHNKIVVYNKTMRTILKLIVDSHNCYVITAFNEIFVLVEHDIQSKVRLLIKKNLYDVSLNVLKGSENDEMLAEVNMQYGDYLLSKGDLAGSVNKYVKTIGYIESYRIIRNLLDSRYNKYLAEYLRALVHSVHSTADHLELLRSCTEREDLPTKIKNIFITDVENGDYTLYDINNGKSDITITSNHMHFSNFIEIIQDHNQICKILNSWDEEQIYDYLTEYWNYIITKHSKDLLAILKSLFTGNGHSINLAERFVQLLMNDTRVCIEFVEHVLSQYRPDDITPMIRSALIDLYLREWQAGNESKMHVLEAINEQKQYLNIEDLLLQLKRYSFWEGIMSLDERNTVRRLCLQHSDNKFDINDWNPETWLGALEENVQLLNNSTKIISTIMKSLLQDNQMSLLQLLRTVSDNERLTIGQVKDIFTHDNLQSITTSSQQHDITTDLDHQLEELKQLLINYSTRPIEFRSNFCDICKKQLNPPALYYVCQHAFHKECVLGYTNNKSCIACITKESSRSNYQQGIARNTEPSGITDETNGITIEAIAKYLSIGNVQISDSKQVNKINPTSTIGSNNTQHWQGRFNISGEPKPKPQTKIKSSNPFEDGDNDEDGYDANLNPFEK